MQFTPEVKEELQEFLVKELTPISTAKPSVLAEYVSALLKKGQTNLAGSLQEFLKDHTEGFVAKLNAFVKTLEDGGKLSQSRGLTPAQESKMYGDEDEDGRSADRNFKRSSRRRRSEDRDERSFTKRHRDADYDRDSRFGRRDSYRRRSRSPPARGRGSRSPTRNVERRDRRKDETTDTEMRMDGEPAQTQKCRDYEEKGVCYKGDDCPFDHGTDRISVPTPEVLKQNLPIPPFNPDQQQQLPHPLSQQQQFRSRGGFGMNMGGANRGSRGQQHPHQHRMNFNPPRPMPPGNMGQEWMQAPFMGGGPPMMGQMGPMGPRGPLRHNNNANAPMGMMPQHLMPPMGNNANSQQEMRMHDMGGDDEHIRSLRRNDQGDTFSRGKGHDGDRGGRNSAQRGGRAAVGGGRWTAAIRRLEWRTSLPECMNITKVNEHFSKFGTITNVELLPRQKKAFVTFSSHFQAGQAVRSPDAVFGNRFVKVFWARDEEKGESADSGSKEGKTEAVSESQQQALQQAAELKKRIEAKDKLKQLEKEREALHKRQLERQKELLTLLETSKSLSKDEKKPIFKELETLTAFLKDEFSKKKEGLEAKMEHKTPSTTSKPLTKSGSEKNELAKELLDRELDLLQKIKSEETEGDSATTESSKSEALSKLEKLEQKKADLKKQAEQMGLDVSQVLSGTPRGRGYHRGGYLPRGRGRGRGVRGRGVAGGRGRGRGRATMSLDLRPKTLLLSNLPAELQSENGLREHLQESNARVESINVSDTTASVTFVDRRNAEIAHKHVSSNKTIAVGWQKSVQTSSGGGVADGGGVGGADSSDSMANVEVYGEVEQTFSDEEEDDERSWKR